MPDYLYRFRSADALLHKFEELEKGEIFFSLTSELNDPMEGFTDVFWKGGETLWSNLIRHYLYCLIQCFYLGMVLRDDFKHNLIEANVKNTPLSLKGLPVEKAYLDVCNMFLERRGVQHLIGQLVNRDVAVRRNELATYFRLIHPIAIYCVLQKVGELRADQSEDKTVVELDLFRAAADTADGLLSRFPDRAEHKTQQDEIIFAQMEIAAQQMYVITYDRRIQNPSLPMWNQFIDTFPKDYISAIEKMVYPNWHVASFTSNPENASMWGVYGDAHRGFCLKFRVQKSPEGKEILSLHGVTGSGYSAKEGHRVLRGLRNLAFSPVDYEGAHPEIDFFRTFGRFTVQAMQDFWFCRADGSLDPAYSEIFGDEDAWRSRYWSLYEALVSVKLPEWSHEQEHRLVHSSQINDLSPTDMRKDKYKFEDLDGIIFGSKSKLEDQLKVIEIVGRKCKEAGRKEFNFYQMVYNRLSRSFEMVPLSLIKFKSDNNLTRPINPQSMENDTLPSVIEKAN